MRLIEFDIRIEYTLTIDSNLLRRRIVLDGYIHHSVCRELNVAVIIGRQSDVGIRLIYIRITEVPIPSTVGNLEQVRTFLQIGKLNPVVHIQISEFRRIPTDTGQCTCDSIVHLAVSHLGRNDLIRSILSISRPCEALVCA